MDSSSRREAPRRGPRAIGIATQRVKSAHPPVVGGVGGEGIRRLNRVGYLIARRPRVRVARPSKCGVRGDGEFVDEGGT